MVWGTTEELRVLFPKHPIRRQSILRSGRCSLVVGENSKQVGLLEICSKKPHGHGLTGIMPAPEQPCSPASSHGRLSFRPGLVTTAHAHAVKPFVTVLSWDEAAIYSLNSTDCG